MIHRGEVYFVSLSPTKGREQRGHRPVLVVSDDAINSQPLVISVVVGTDARHIPRDYPVNVRVTAEESGLPSETVFLCFQIRSIDPSRFTDRDTGESQPVGRVSLHKMREVEQALKFVLRLP